MRSKKGILVVMAGLAMSASAHAEDGKWYDALSLGGYIQGSYVANLNNPSDRMNDGRAFDQEAESFNLNAFQLKVAKPLGDDGYGFTGKFHTGRDARIIKGAGTA